MGNMARGLAMKLLRLAKGAGRLAGPSQARRAGGGALAKVTFGLVCQMKSELNPYVN
jgi:hypothetical protein